MLAHRIRLLVVTSVLVLTGCGSGDGERGAAVGTGKAPASTAPTVAESPTAAESPLAFTATTLDGKPFDGRSLAGKPSVLWFWAPWCPTCLSQAPGIRAAAERYAGKVTIVGVAGLASAEEMPDFVRMAKVEALPHLSDEPGVLWRRFQVREQSIVVLLDATGAVAFQGRLTAAELPAKIGTLVG